MPTYDMTLVICVVAAPETDWTVGDVLPCRSDQFEAAE